MFSVIPKRSLVHRHLYPSIRPRRSQPHGRTAAVVPDRNSRRGRKKRGTSAPLQDRREALPEEGKSNLLFQPLFFPPLPPHPSAPSASGTVSVPRRAAPVPAGSAAERPGAVRNAGGRGGGGGRGGSRTRRPSGGRRRNPPAARSSRRSC